MDILEQARRRWVVARGLEWSAVAAVAAAAGALPVLVAWSVAYRFETLAVALCTLPLLAAMIVVAGPVSRACMATSPVLRGVVAGVLVSVFVGGLAGVLMDEYLRVPRAAWLLHVVASAGAGVSAAWVCRPDVARTALWLDERLGLRERMATSAALRARDCQDAMASAVYAQAVEEAQSRGVRTAPMWTRGRGTVGALCLSLLAFLTLLLMPMHGPAGAAGAMAGWSDRAVTMSPDQLRRLAEQLRNTAAAEAEGTRRIHEAAAAAEAGDTELLAKSLAVLAALIEEGKIRLVKLPSALAQGRLGDDHGGASGGQVGDGNATATANNQSPPPSHTDTVAPDHTQLVFHADYVRLTELDFANESATPPAASYRSFDFAWDQARALASQSLRDGDIPSNRRQAVREFFRTP